MSDRRDFLSVCNDQGVPLPDFQATFCVRCVQPECSRSRAGGLFESRVATWQERLFVNPPKMPKEDPLYGVISAKKFRDIDVPRRVPEVGGTSTVSTWVDPLTLPETPSAPRPLPRASVRRPPSQTVEAVSEELDESGEGSGESAAEAPPSTPLSTSGLPANTPFTQGTMIGGAPPPSPRDPWRADGSLETVARPTGSGIGRADVISPGAKIRFRAP